jgi:hypothetical protein
VAHAFNPSFLGDIDWEGHDFRQALAKQIVKIHLNKQAGCGGHTCILATGKEVGRRVAF